MWKYEKLMKLSLLYNWVARFTCIDDIKEIVRNMYVESARLVEWFYNKTRWVIVLRVTLEKWESIYIVFWKNATSVMDIVKLAMWSFQTFNSGYDVRGYKMLNVTMVEKYAGENKRYQL